MNKCDIQAPWVGLSKEDYEELVFGNDKCNDHDGDLSDVIWQEYKEQKTVAKENA